MILPHTYAVTLILMILSLVCWGSWANTYKLTGKWRFELFYFDFALGLMLASLIYAFTVGSLGYDGFTFYDDLMHAGKRQWAYGFAGGVIFNFGNMLLLSAISVAGMSVALPIGIGFALVVGVGLNSLINPQGSGNLLLGGCLAIMAAIVAIGYAYRAIGLIRHERLAKAGLAKSTRRPSPVKGIVLALVGGFLMGTFLPLIDKGKEGEIGLGPYAVAVMFAAGVLISTVVFNMFFMNLPIEGEPVDFFDYFKGQPGHHLLGVIGGMIMCTAIVAVLVAAIAGSDPLDKEAHVGPAIAYVVAQGGALLGALWGLLAWGEFRGADGKVKILAVLSLLMFAAGVTAIAMAPLYVNPA